jgi:crotonobetainyl-CoA:carnitine CoA-transferase CaiB-like acyl-CoA transferase
MKALFHIRHSEQRMADFMLWAPAMMRLFEKSTNYCSHFSFNFAFQLCSKMEMPELADIPEFKTNSDRVKNRETLLAKFAEK